jgi:hypothetical protein
MVVRADMNERRDYYRAPATGEDSATVLDQALVTLGRLRDMGGWIGDAGVDLHLLMSLLEEAKSRIPRAVADARDQEYSWAEIADLLGVTRASAWQRYASRTEKNRTPVED